MLGDSFTFGEDLNDDETYPSYLQELLGPRIEVINLGVHGYGHDQMLLKLQQEGIQYQPDIILLGFIPMDMARDVVNFRDYAKPQYFLKEDGLILKNVPIPTIRELWIREIFRLHIWDAVRLVADRLQAKKGITQRKKLQITEALLEEMRKVSESVHAKFVLLYLPLQYELERSIPEEKFITDYARRKGLLLCHPREDLRTKMVNQKYSTATGHYEAATQRVVAESLSKCLREQGGLLDKVKMDSRP